METIEATTLTIPTARLHANSGQIDGVPANPRKISRHRLVALKKSLQDAPEMLHLRELIVYPHGGGYVVIGGNMRLRAARSLGLAELPCKVLHPSTPAAKLREYAIKDNNAFGEDDSDLLSSWDVAELNEWGYLLDEVDIEHPRKVFGRNGAILTTLRLRPCLHYGKLPYISLYDVKCKDDAEGVALEQIKQPRYVRTIADDVATILAPFVVNPRPWSIVSTPPRRHKDWNFGEELCKAVSDATGVPFVQGFAEVHGADRLNVQLRQCKSIDTDGVILVDDILTTGNTVQAMRELLPDKNIITIIGVMNKYKQK